MSSVRVLDFDLENRPLSYLGQDFTTAEVTAIAACFHDDRASMRVWLLGQDRPEAIVEEFREMYDSADIVTGHFIRGHDLPKINGTMIEYGRAPLDEKLSVDTKLDLLKHGHIISASQENLCAMLGLAAPKVQMNTVKWRAANRLTPEGLEYTRKRAVGDVVQHIALYRALVKRGLLGAPRVWRP